MLFKETLPLRDRVGSDQTNPLKLEINLKKICLTNALKGYFSSRKGSIIGSLEIL
jgi:hypothetical protein